MRFLAGRSSPPSIPLPEGASVGVIGAGPAGSFFALHLIRLLRESGRSVRVALIDRKTFASTGPSGCNMCAGAIGDAMFQKINRLAIPLDERVIRRIADGYEIHGRAVSVMVQHQDRCPIYTVFRGGGPATPSGNAKSFDQHLLDAAVAQGAEFVHERVEKVDRTKSGFRLGFAGERYRDFDFLVGAFGVNTSIAQKMPRGYVPPRTWHTVQAEIPADNDFIVQRLKARIHIIPAWGKVIRFLAITPKDDFLTLTGIGEHVKLADLEAEKVNNMSLARLLPEKAKVFCHCHPQAPVGVARSPFSDRLAIIGDAFISRYLKNGIESSHDTALILAEAVTEHGISEEALRAHFYRPCLNRFRYDNVWGRILFGIYESVLRKGRLSDPYLRSVSREAAAGRTGQERILWSVFAGDLPYRDIAREALTPRSIWQMSRNIIAGR